MGKSEKMRLRTRVWAQAPKPSSFAEQTPLDAIRCKTSNVFRSDAASWLTNDLPWLCTLVTFPVVWQPIVGEAP